MEEAHNEGENRATGDFLHESWDEGTRQNYVCPPEPPATQAGPQGFAKERRSMVKLLRRAALWGNSFGERARIEEKTLTAT